MYKILIIEDEDDIRENIKDVFELCGDEVSIASNGKQGIELAKLIVPDIIICDIAMPYTDGFQVKKTLDTDRKTSSIPFIFLTAKADISSMRAGMGLGADDYIVKPIRSKELVEIVYKRIGRISTFKSSNYENTENKKLSIDDNIPINTGKEHLFLRVKDIVVITVDQDYTIIHTSDGKKHILKKTIKSWEENLSEKHFIRVHRNFLLNSNYIKKIEPWFNGSLIAEVKHYPEKVKFSKRYSQKFKKILKS